jgi:hypothetical protein
MDRFPQEDEYHLTLSELQFDGNPNYDSRQSQIEFYLTSLVASGHEDFSEQGAQYTVPAPTQTTASVRSNPEDDSNFLRDVFVSTQDDGSGIENANWDSVTLRAITSSLSNSITSQRSERHREELGTDSDQPLNNTAMQADQLNIGSMYVTAQNITGASHINLQQSDHGMPVNFNFIAPSDVPPNIPEDEILAGISVENGQRVIRITPTTWRARTALQWRRDAIGITRETMHEASLPVSSSALW